MQMSDEARAVAGREPRESVDELFERMQKLDELLDEPWPLPVRDELERVRSELDRRTKQRAYRETREEERKRRRQRLAQQKKYVPVAQF